MKEYTTVLLQIISSKLSEDELCSKMGMRNFARQQPSAPYAYFCFETAAGCESDELNEHIKCLEGVLSSVKGFIHERLISGDEVSVLWFPSKNAESFSLLSPDSMKFLGDLRIPLLIQNKG